MTAWERASRAHASFESDRIGGQLAYIATHALSSALSFSNLNTPTPRRLRGNHHIIECGTDQGAHHTKGTYTHPSNFTYWASTSKQARSFIQHLQYKPAIMLDL
eukprot:1136835-Pelagomonas_calceolata.AAC.5